MAYVVTEPCVDCKYTDCVTVCPTDCFHEGEVMLYIDPEECIDCGACVAECPVEAIFFEQDLPQEWRPYAHLNAEMAAQTPPITQRQAPLLGPQCAEGDNGGVSENGGRATLSGDC